ncbi:MAG: ATP-dependent protease ATPase subunit HslU [Actinomycetia bacterium]|nr:ATP-dependent protease ATPase subunit HslU [Actinomycetes bacterium]
MDEAELTPAAIVAELDRYIVGQAAAKRAVANALRHRWRRAQLDPALQEDVYPKNILMIGPTGVGKTEIARRLARLVRAPFVKVEATKFTEVGYVGRDVDTMVRDLVEVSLRMVKEERVQDVREQAERQAEERILDALAPVPKPAAGFRNPFEQLFGGPSRTPEPPPDRQAVAQAEARRQAMRERLRRGELEREIVEVEVEDQAPPLPVVGIGTPDDMQSHLGEMLQGLLPRRTKRRRMTVAEARKVLTQEEAQKLIDNDAAQAEAIFRAEQQGIIFIDEFDKIASSRNAIGPDVSREGVQRDILPIVEGSTVMTKYGPVRTDHILFIAAGAFHVSKPSDLIPELQGRFPIRVELEPLTEADFVRILVEPHHSLITQYQALLATEGVTLEFTPEAIERMAQYAARVNQEVENIGARRLHTILERVLEELSFHAPSLKGQTVTITAGYVDERLKSVAEAVDVNRYIL